MRRTQPLDIDVGRKLVRRAVTTGATSLGAADVALILRAYGLPLADGLGGPPSHEQAPLRVRMERDLSFGVVILVGAGGDERLVLLDSSGVLGDEISPDGAGDVVRALAAVAADRPEVTAIDVSLAHDGDGPAVLSAGAAVLGEASLVNAPPVQDSHLDLRAVCAPRSIAVIGASDDVRKWGGSALRNILDGGFQGAVYPVSPRGGEFFGLPVYASIDEVPEAPDIALLAVRSSLVPGVLDGCARRGARAAVVITAGFGETGGDGLRAERDLAAAATAAGLTLVGPNCMGVVTNETRLHGTGYITLHPPEGPLSLVSQSGNLGAQLVKAAERRGIGLEKFVSSGNEAQVTTVDLLDYLRTDDRTGCILLYVEGIDDGRRFIEVAAATTAVKPVVVLRGGLTEPGVRSAKAHTGATSGGAAVYAAAARQAGIVTCTAMDEAMDLVAALSFLPLPSGRRVAVASNGGGVGVLAVDEMAHRGLELPGLPAELVEELDEVLPPFWSRRNMVDMVATAGDTAGVVLSALARCDAFDAVVMLSALAIPSTQAEEERAAAPGGDRLSRREEELLALTAELMEETGKPIVHISDMPLTRSVFPQGARFSPVVLPSPRAAALAIDSMARYAQHLSICHPVD
jgi:acyl-CoA synthetase (NDP forming)